MTPRYPERGLRAIAQIERSSPQDRAIVQLKLAFDAFATVHENMAEAQRIQRMINDNIDPERIALTLALDLVEILEKQCEPIS